MKFGVTDFKQPILKLFKIKITEATGILAIFAFKKFNHRKIIDPFFLLTHFLKETLQYWVDCTVNTPGASTELCCDVANLLVKGFTSVIPNHPLISPFLLVKLLQVQYFFSQNYNNRYR